MSQTAVDDTRGDPQLARICELGQLMALPPRDLIARLKADGQELRHGEQDRDPATSVRAIPALASLASIVSTLEQEPLPARGTFEPAAPARQPAGRDLAHHCDEEAMPALSTWRGAQIGAEQDHWIGQHIRAAAFGLLAGLAAIAITLLWLNGWLDGPRRPELTLPSAPALERSAEPEHAQPGPETAPLRLGKEDPPAPNETSGRTDAGPAPAAPASEPPPAATPSSRTLVQEAAQRIGVGDVAGARELLAGADSDAEGLVPYALAETYDPNMLAAWGARGIAADIARAKELYAEALSLGNEQARQRLDALQ